MIRPYLLAVLCMCLACSSARECNAADRLTVVYTGNTRGKLRACGCPGDPYGGLAERATLIKQLREQEKPFLLLDSGNMVSLFGDYSRKAGCVIKLMNLMNYDAVGIGFNELYYGLERFSTLWKSVEFPLLSASVAPYGESSPATAPSTVITVGTATAGIVGISDPASHKAMGIPKVNDYRILEPGESCDILLSELRQTCDFVIVLSHLSKEKNRSFLAAHPSIDLLIQGWGNEKLDPPVLTSGGIIAAPGGRGQHVGIIEMERSGNGTVHIIRHEFKPVLDIPEDKTAQEIVREYYMSIN